MINIIGELNSEMADKVVKELEAEEGSTIEVRLSSTGGEVSAGVIISDCIKELKRKGEEVIIHCSGEVMSSATIIMMSASEVVVHNAIFMFHLSTITIAGNNVQFDNIRPYNDWASTRLTQATFGLLDQGEIEQLFMGNDVYKELSSDRINKGIKEFNQIMGD